MKQRDLGQTIQTLANVGVIAGIVFLGLELRQNNALLQEQARSQFASGLASIKQALYENTGGLASIIVSAAEGKELTAEEVFRLEQFAEQNLILWQQAYVAYREGFVQTSDLNLSGWSNVFNEIVPLMPEAYERNKLFYDPGFVQWMEENIVRPQRSE